MTPFLWLFNYNPVGPAVMVALFGIATVWLVFFVAREFFSTKAALIAASLYAVSPLVIAYSRSSWNPNLLPFFSLLTLYFVYKGIKNNNFWDFLFSGISIGIALQLHYLTTFLGVVVVAFSLIGFVYTCFMRKEKFSGMVQFILKSYLGLLVGFLLGFSLFILFEVRHGFENTKNIIHFILFSKDTGAGNNFISIVNDVFFRLFGRLATDYPPPEQVSLQGHTLITIWYVLTLILAVCAVSFLIYQLVKYIKDRKRFLQYALLFIWLVVGVLLFGFYKKEIYDYYFAFLFPLPFLLIGGFLGYLFEKPNVFKVISSVSFIILFVLNLQAMPFRYTPNRQLNQMETISRFVMDKTNGKPFNFALITGGNSDYAYRYFFTVWGHPPVTIDNYAVDPARKTVTGQLLVVCEEACHPEGDSLWEVAGFGRAKIAGEWNVSVVQVYKLVHYTGK